ncbi:predicted protein [Uncinocarpus reesii 1704]|uniref:Uncharacterized protein n=1 Tax=Uncinocarpus reesii (strain UAMH 1704) TaxID=336963 RepID=C4JKK9_UNCRE|nr:uncharacterized protein UREG_02166 [Uncinocarpus reesii 1704]EEP77317.1 predicted protein [Uncinocarpus reesii 1704]
MAAVNRDGQNHNQEQNRYCPRRSGESTSNTSGNHDVNGAADQLEDVLSTLPADTPVYQYRGTTEMKRTIDCEWQCLQDSLAECRNVHQQSLSHVKSELIVYSGVSSDIFSREIDPESAPDSPIGKARIDFWVDLELLILTMLTRPHEAPRALFGVIIFDKLKHMGLNPRRTLQIAGASRVATESRRKEPDCSYLPKSLPDGRSDKWPSLIVEVGFTESARKLEMDAKWWLQASNGDVGLAITITVNARDRSIVLKTWENGPGDTGPQSALPRATQTVSVLGSIDPENPVVRNGPFLIPFQKLLLRDSVDSEGDIALNEEDLTNLSVQLWA